MKIRIMSDLHLEVTDFEVTNSTNADVLVLAGDILVSNKLRLENSEEGKKFRAFLETCSQQFNHTVYVAGNHEFYNGGRFYQGLDWLHKYCGVYPNVHFLEDELVEIDSVVFVGSTLWTDFNRYDPLTMMDAEGMMNDYRATVNDRVGYRKLMAKDVAQRHSNSLGYIKTVLDDRKDKTCVVVTHHSPSFQSVNPHYRGQGITNGLYHSDLDQFIIDRPQIKLWCHGHTHCPMDYRIDNTRIVCNPRGYARYNEYTGWDPLKTVELEFFNEQNVQGQAMEV